jgi:hypothetical protein
MGGKALSARNTAPAQKKPSTADRATVASAGAMTLGWARSQLDIFRMAISLVQPEVSCIVWGPRKKFRSNCHYLRHVGYGSSSDFDARSCQARFTSMNGHHQATSVGPKSADSVEKVLLG